MPGISSFNTYSISVRQKLLVSYFIHETGGGGAVHGAPLLGSGAWKCQSRDLSLGSCGDAPARAGPSTELVGPSPSPGQQRDLEKAV